MKELVLLMILMFSFIFHVAEKYLVGRRDWFGVIVNLLLHLELFIYAKPISFLVGSTNVYVIIFYQMYLLPYPIIPAFFYLVLWNPGDAVFGMLDHLNIFISVCKTVLWLE